MQKVDLHKNQRRAALFAAISVFSVQSIIKGEHLMSRPGTNKITNSLFAFWVFMMAWFICAGVLSSTSAKPYAWVIGAFFALVVAVGTYFLCDMLQENGLNRQEKMAQKILQPVLPLGETLQAFVRGYTGPGRTGMIMIFGALGDSLINAPRRKWYYLGLTQQYLALVQVNGKKPTGVQQVLRRGEVRNLTWAGGALKNPKLILQLAADRMEFLVDYDMGNRAKLIDKAWHNEV
jgi:hypothetical protein